MESITEIYKIGNGPSSSHTIAPGRAAAIFSQHNASAAGIRVTLYGSLGATGKGHLTDLAVINAIAPKPCEIVWRAEIVPDFHTNGMLFEALDASGAVVNNWVVYSVGGGTISQGSGRISFGGEDQAVSQSSYEIPVGHPDCAEGDNIAGVLVHPYRRSHLTEIREFIEQRGYHFWEYVVYHEGPAIKKYLAKVWDQMQKSVEEGLENDTVLPGSIRLRSKAKQYYRRATSLKENLQTRALVTAYALAVSEQNARGGLVVTAPTCGSCGVLPSVLYHMKHCHGLSDSDILKALATAALFGNIIKENASLSGAEVGCQGEVGSACVMAAVAVNQLFGGSPTQIECAAEMAMEHNLGLTCDPVCGLVQIPCIERNAVAALRAMDVSLYALISDGKQMVSFDAVVDTMKRTGHDIPSPYKETAEGGLAADAQWMMNDETLA